MKWLLEAVLGYRLQALLVPSSKDMFEALDFLKQQSKGRAGFFDISDTQSPPSLKENIGQGLLRDFVSTSQEYRYCIDRLLYKVCLVESPFTGFVSSAS